jgi:hypothetical protein
MYELLFGLNSLVVLELIIFIFFLQDNVVDPLTSKCGAEYVPCKHCSVFSNLLRTYSVPLLRRSAQSHSADKKSGYDPEELEESESKTPLAYGQPRNILLSLRSASARKTKPTRRSARLVPKVCVCHRL